MKQHDEYEPIIVDLQKSQIVTPPKQYLPIVALTLLVLAIGTLMTFAALYYPKSNPQIGPQHPQPTPQPAAMVELTPTPIPNTPTPIPQPPQPTPTPTVMMGALTLYSYPEHADVVIDGEKLGETPLENYALPPGTYTIKFVHEGQTVSKQLKILAGEVTEYTHRFAGFGSLLVETTSSGSDIFVNGELQGQSPVRVERLAPGTYVIVAKKVGYGTVEKIVSLKKGEHKHLFMTIKRLDLLPRPSSEPSPDDETEPLHPSERQQMETTP